MDESSEEKLLIIDDDSSSRKHPLLIRNDDHSLQSNYVEYNGYGNCPEKAIKNLIYNLNFKHIYYYHSLMECNKHNCKHCYIYLINDTSPYVVIFNQDKATRLWQSSLKYPSK
jgi:hypothetical protein